MAKTIKFYLPLGQAALVVLLMLLNSMRDAWGAWSAIERQVSYGINAPAAFISFFLAKLQLDISPLVNEIQYLFFTYAFYFMLVVMLWYAVALEVSGGSNGSSLTSLTRFRETADLMLVALGLFLIFLGVMNFDLRSARRSEMPSSIGCLVWGVVVTSFYVRDLYICTKRRATTVR